MSESTGNSTDPIVRRAHSDLAIEIITRLKDTGLECLNFGNKEKAMAFLEAAEIVTEALDHFHGTTFGATVHPDVYRARALRKRGSGS